MVDLREFIDVDTFTSLDGDCETESHVLSSQRTADAPSELSTLSPSPQPRHSTIREVVDQIQPAPAPALPEIGDDHDDLPSWMTKRGQWNYIVSTTGGPSWEDLLRVYLRQERRLEFTETVRNLPYKSFLFAIDTSVGSDTHNSESSIQNQRVFPVCSQTIARRYRYSPYVWRGRGKLVG